MLRSIAPHFLLQVSSCDVAIFDLLCMFWQTVENFVMFQVSSCDDATNSSCEVVANGTGKLQNITQLSDTMLAINIQVKSLAVTAFCAHYIEQYKWFNSSGLKR